jgi:hypothetical protein
MKKTQFTESQIIAMLKQHEQGVKVQDIARSNGISEKQSIVGKLSMAVWMHPNSKESRNLKQRMQN